MQRPVAHGNAQCIDGTRVQTGDQEGDAKPVSGYCGAPLSAGQLAGAVVR